MTYSEKLKDPRWQELRRAFMDFKKHEGYPDQCDEMNDFLDEIERCRDKMQIKVGLARAKNSVREMVDNPNPERVFTMMELAKEFLRGR